LERGRRRVVLVLEEETAAEQRRQRRPFIERRRTHVAMHDRRRRFDVSVGRPLHDELLWIWSAASSRRFGIFERVQAHGRRSMGQSDPTDGRSWAFITPQKSKSGENSPHSKSETYNESRRFLEAQPGLADGRQRTRQRQTRGAD